MYAWAGVVILMATTVLVVVLAWSQLRWEQRAPTWEDCRALAVSTGRDISPDECQ